MRYLLLCCESVAQLHLGAADKLIGKFTDAVVTLRGNAGKKQCAKNLDLGTQRCKIKNAYHWVKLFGLADPAVAISEPLTMLTGRRR